MLAAQTLGTESRRRRPSMARSNIHTEQGLTVVPQGWASPGASCLGSCWYCRTALDRIAQIEAVGISLKAIGGIVFMIIMKKQLQPAANRDESSLHSDSVHLGMKGWIRDVGTARIRNLPFAVTCDA